MIIGVDFDNTIVCYDNVFSQAALGMGLIADKVRPNKTNMRDYLRQAGKEGVWTELQGLVYGNYIKYAPAFDGVKDFFRYCKRRKVVVYIISHKTRIPYAGCNYDLHEAANKWLQSQGFYDPDVGLNVGNVFFEFTKKNKVSRIKELKCTHFIDDLPEFLEEPDFPNGIEKILFDPHGLYQNNRNFQHLGSWRDIIKMFNDNGTKTI